MERSTVVSCVFGAVWIVECRRVAEALLASSLAAIDTHGNV